MGQKARDGLVLVDTDTCAMGGAILVASWGSETSKDLDQSVSFGSLSRGD